MPLSADTRRKAAQLIERAHDVVRNIVKNCGTGAGGFQPGNDCARGGGLDDDRESVRFFMAKLDAGLNSFAKKTDANPLGIADWEIDMYRRSVMAVLKNVPKDKIARATAIIQGFDLHLDIKDLNKAYDERLSLSGRSARPNGDVLGSWDGARRVLSLDHIREDTFMSGAIFAHELAHVFDYPNYLYSKHAEWQSAWKEELVDGPVGISEYAKTKPSEGFAEFARLVYATDEQVGGYANGLEMARDLFPKCTAYWEKEKFL